MIPNHVLYQIEPHPIIERFYLTVRHKLPLNSRVLKSLTLTIIRFPAEGMDLTRIELVSKINTTYYCLRRLYIIQPGGLRFHHFVL